MKQKKLYEILIAFNVLIFVAMWLKDPQLGSENLIAFGAKYNYGLVNGEWWRLITPIFLHIDVMHLAFNMFAILIIARPLEQVFGKGKLFALYLVSGLGGVILSFALNDNLSAGASGAIFGMMGAHVYLYLRFKDQYKNIFGTDFLGLLVFNLIYGFISPSIDNFGHIGGLLTGIPVAAFLGIRTEKIGQRKGILVLGLTLMVLVALTSFGVKRYDQSPHYKAMHVFELVKEGQNVEAYNYLLQAFKDHPDNEELKRLIQSTQ